jgi:peptidyl-prolyl cis-trans isomerase B (cyclophilin B)
MKYTQSIFALVLAAVVLTACASEKEYLVKIETRHGDMYAVLFDDTPMHKSNFIALAEAGRFDSTQFHRIIDGFMVQGGDVFGKEGVPADKWPTIQAEIKPHLIHSKGMIAAARQGNNANPERRSNGSQFYIVQGKVYDKTELVTDAKLLSEAFYKYIQLGSNEALKNEYARLYSLQEFDSLNQMMLAKKADLETFYGISLEKKMSPAQIEAYTTVGGTPHLDQEYTVFGRIIEGLEVMEKIAAEPKDQRDVPLEPVFMKVSVSQVPKTKITKSFGYNFQ